MSLRIATLDDFDIVYKFLSNLLEDPRFKYLASDENILKGLVRLHSDPTKQDQFVCLIMSQDDKDVGAMAVQKVSLYGLSNMATVIAVYLEPAYQNKGFMKEFMDAFEYWAKLTGCSHCNIGSRDIDFTKHGYERYEVMYIKEIK